MGALNFSEERIGLKLLPAPSTGKEPEVSLSNLG